MSYLDPVVVFLKNLITAKGDIPVGTASGAVTNVAVGANGLALIADSNQSPGVKWLGSAGLLAVNAYDPGTTTTYTITSTTVADVDATNMAVTFTAPPSGKVLIRLTARCGVAAGTGTNVWGLREATTDVAKFSHVVPGTIQARTAMFLITGLTQGSSHTYKWSFAGDGTNATNIYAGESAGSQGAAVMEVWAA